MKKFRGIYVFLLLLFISNHSFSQYFSFGQDPASVKWQQIQTRNFQVIFPESFSGHGNRVANILEFAYEKVSHSLDHQPRKITVIVHNQTIVSNGFVAPAPNRMELFSVPPQRNQVTPWLEHLAVHELRHVVQIDKMNQGISRILSYVFGEQATGAVAGLFPMWFYEGDAVIAETILSEGGRGRFPDFSKELRTNILDSSRRFGFNKMLLGSYQHNTPNHYSLGYHLAAYARSHYGEEIWSDVVDHVARKPYQVFAFNRGLKKYAGVYSGELYQSALSHYDSLWQNTLKKFEIQQYEQINKREKKEYASYTFPQPMNSDSLVALKSDLSHWNRFVLLSEGKEQVLHVPGILTSKDFSYASHKIVWSERRPDVRWAHRDFSELRLYDLKENTEKQLTERTRLFAPSLSPDGELVVAVSVSQNNQYTLLVLDTKHGWRKRAFQSKNNMFLQRPVWSPDGNHIYVIALTDNGKAVYRINYNNGQWKQVIPPTFEDINNLAVTDQYLYFHSTLNDIDNIFASDLVSGKIFRVTSSKYGAKDVSYDAEQKKLIFSEYSALGYDVKSLHADQSSFVPVQMEDRPDQIIRKLEKQEPPKIDFNEEEFIDYKSKPYRKWKHLFNFHSWAPFYFDQDQLMYAELDVKPGFTLLSQNNLSTAFTNIGYSFESGTHKIHSSFTYRGWYPVIRISSNFGGKPELIRVQNVDWAPKLSNDYLDVNLDVSLPLDLSVGRNVTRFIPSVEYEFTKDYYYNYQNDYYLRGIKTIDYQLNFQSYQRLAYRDIFPPLGILVNLHAKSSPFTENVLGNMFSIQGKFYLPGFVEDHGVSLAGGYQNQNPELYLFSSYLSFPRGYQSLYTEKLYTFKGDYVFPLYYPDWEIGPLMYIKRFKAGFFYDYALNQYRSQNSATQEINWVSKGYQSAGVELTADFHLFRFMFPLSAGLRYVYQPTISDAKFEFILDIDLFSIYKNRKKQ
jgi:hypothetical protein